MESQHFFLSNSFPLVCCGGTGLADWLPYTFWHSSSHYSGTLFLYNSFSVLPNHSAPAVARAQLAHRPGPHSLGSLNQRMKGISGFTAWHPFPLQSVSSGRLRGHWASRLALLYIRALFLTLFRQPFRLQLIFSSAKPSSPLARAAREQAWS